MAATPTLIRAKLVKLKNICPTWGKKDFLYQYGTSYF